MYYIPFDPRCVQLDQLDKLWLVLQRGRSEDQDTKTPEEEGGHWGCWSSLQPGGDSSLFWKLYRCCFPNIWDTFFLCSNGHFLDKSFHLLESISIVPNTISRPYFSRHCTNAVPFPSPFRSDVWRAFPWDCSRGMPLVWMVELFILLWRPQGKDQLKGTRGGYSKRIGSFLWDSSESLWRGHPMHK